MKIAQFHDRDRIRLGLVEGDALIPTDFEGGALDYILKGSGPLKGGEPIPLKMIRFASPLTGPSKIIAIGLNYMDHVRESHGKIPANPIVFAKFPNTLIGHGEDIVWDPNLTTKVDFEAELAVVIGKRICRCDEIEAMEAVYGYTCANDVSARDIQFGDVQWVRGKSLDTFCPLGPWIVTSDEIPDPHALPIRSRLNGKIMQDSNTGEMIFRLPALISFLSASFTLLPGDVILTGTPHGVGGFREPSIYMKDGDGIEVEIQGIGSLENTCRTI